MNDIKKPSWIFFTEWASTIAIFIACFLFLNNQIGNLQCQVAQQGARTDRLYEMFIDLLKEGKK